MDHHELKQCSAWSTLLNRGRQCVRPRKKSGRTGLRRTNLYVIFGASSVLAQRLDKTKLLSLVGVGATSVGALGRAKKATKWTTVVVAKATPPPDSGRFFRSVGDHVDSADKKANFTTMIAELCDAIEVDDYQGALKEAGVVSVKIAHSFEYAKQKHHVWELKYGKKDRIYFYPFPQRRLIFLLMAYHKKDQQTPKNEVCNPCESDIKLILDPRGNIEFC